MKRSTGGRVLRDRTSVKVGRRCLRLLAHSSCWRFSSSMMLVTVVAVDDGEGRGKERLRKSTKDWWQQLT